MKKNYEYLMGKSKNDVLKELGDEFNFYPDEVWTYILKTKWWQKSKILHLFFQKNTVHKIEIK